MRLRGTLYSLLMEGAGKNFQVAHSATLNSITELRVGDNVYIGNNTVLLCGGGISIGSNTLVAHGVVISSNNHTYEPPTGYRFGKPDFSPVNIGEGCWICANSVITRGTHLPPFCILSPCSVLSRSSIDRPMHSLYSGNPATHVKFLDHA